MNDQIVLSVRDLTVRFGALTAVNNVSFDARRGHITSVIGPNGAGKSTLFNLISGAIRPSSGKVTFDGHRRHRARAGPPDERAGLARSFQITNLFFELSVFENLRLAAQALEAAVARAAAGAPQPHRARTRRRTDRPVRPVGQGATNWPATCRTANSAGSRSRWRWPAGQACCCSTSRPRACRRPTPRKPAR